MDKIDYLIVGSNGLLGQKIIALLQQQKRSFVATSKGKNRNPDCPNEKYCELDITDKDQVYKCVEKFKPKVIINTAAMTNVDACEDHKDECYQINVKAVEYLLNVSTEINAHLIHYSTDFIFDGKNGPYREEDLAHPLSVYGQSKWESEKLLNQSNYNKISILRTIIVYGLGHNLSRGNIFIWAREKLLEGEKLTIVDDQFRAPTYAKDLAKASIDIAEKNVYGTYHVAGPETLSMFEIIQRLAKWLKIDENQVLPITSDTLNQKADRPPKTGFILDKIQQKIQYQPLTLEESFQDMWR